MADMLFKTVDRVGTSAGPDRPYSGFAITLCTSSTPNMSNWRTSQLFELIGSVSKLAELDADHDFHLRSEVSDSAIKILNKLRHVSCELPRLLPEDNECLSLTWCSGNLKHYLSIYHDEFESSVINKANNVVCTQSFEFDGEPDFDVVLKAVDGTPLSLTAG